MRTMPRRSIPTTSPGPYRSTSRGKGLSSGLGLPPVPDRDRKSTRLNSSHVAISYAVFCFDSPSLALHSFPTRRSSDLEVLVVELDVREVIRLDIGAPVPWLHANDAAPVDPDDVPRAVQVDVAREGLE